MDPTRNVAPAALLDAALQSPPWELLVPVPPRYREVEDIEFWHDVVDGSKRSSDGIAQHYLRLLGQARHRIVIETPYLVFSPQMKAALLAARRRGVEIRILTNSLESNDHTLVHAGYANQRNWLRSKGIQLWEWHGHQTVHAKSTVIDQRIAVFGSYNADMLSEQRNSEVAVVIADADVVRTCRPGATAHVTRDPSSAARVADRIRCANQ